MAKRRSSGVDEPAHEPFAMARPAGKGCRTLSVAALLMVLLLPGGASAGWGNENWGEMLWSGAAIPVPSLSIEGLIALAGLLVFISGTFLARAGPSDVRFTTLSRRT